MAEDSRVVSVQGAHVAREYGMVSACGGCSVHSDKIAEEVGSGTVVVPKAASVFCALGMLEADIRLDNVKTYNAVFQEDDDGGFTGIDLEDFNRTIAAVEEQALAELLQEGVEQERTTLLRYLDMRYVGQHHEVTVEIPHNCTISEVHLGQIAVSFHAAHELLYTYSTPETALELMNLRITAVGAVEKTGLYKLQAGAGETAAVREGKRAQESKRALKGKRQVYFDGQFVETDVYDRDKLFPGHFIPGPAVVEERTTTVIVHPGWELTIDDYENIIMERSS